MYYLYKKAKDNGIPECNYIIKGFKEFYDLAELLTVTFNGSYHIMIKNATYNEIMEFIQVSESYNHMMIYIEVSDTLLEYISLRKPHINVLDSQSNFELYQELISKYGILFEKNVHRILYYSIGHTYSDMDDALSLIKFNYPNKVVTKDDISKLFVVDDTVYPRNVLLAYLRLDFGRQHKLKKCIDTFGNDMVFYSMRKTSRKLLEEKIKFLKSGSANKVITNLNVNNLIRMLNVLDYNNKNGFRDVYTLMSLYEKGETINDTLQEGTLSTADEKYYSLR